MTHSTTKYMDGHALTVGGCIVDSGNFRLERPRGKISGLTTPDDSYHGVVYTEKFGKKAYITKATAQMMRDLGSIQAPMNAFLLNIGLETLHLRVPRHCENAQKVAEWLSAREDVAWVKLSRLKDNKYHALAEKYMPSGSCGVISFRLKRRTGGCGSVYGPAEAGGHRHPCGRRQDPVSSILPAIPTVSFRMSSWWRRAWIRP